jgi:hypothetical protein
MIDPTPDEIDFIRRLAARQGEMDLYGGINLFQIERLIPDYLTNVYAGFGPAHFSLTETDWELAHISNADIKSRSSPPMSLANVRELGAHQRG